jgi:putative nucleotidyltransferase with HDIG domain
MNEYEQIKQSDSLESAFEDPDREIVQSIIELVDQLPALPIVVHKILQMIQTEDTSAAEIAEVIVLDSALAMRVLSLVNSALYAIQNPVTTVQHAVALLGFTEVKNLVLGLKLMEAFPGEETTVVDRDKHWEHSLACGLCAKNLAQSMPQVEPDEAFLGGLLHDIGKMVFDTYFQTQWEEVQRKAEDEGSSPLKLEKELIGADHALVGEWVGRHWHLPTLYQSIIRYHHQVPLGVGDIDPVARQYCALTQAANILVRWLHLGSSGFSPLQSVPREILDLLGISEPQAIEGSLEKTLTEMEQWKRTLGLDKPSDAYDADPDLSRDAHPLWVICSRKFKVPVLYSLLRTLCNEVHVSHWGEKLLSLADNIPHQAIIMDLRNARVDQQKFVAFLRSIRSQSSAPVLVVFSEGNELKTPTAQKVHDIYFLQGTPPHRGTLSEWLRKTLS